MTTPELKQLLSRLMAAYDKELPEETLFAWGRCLLHFDYKKASNAVDRVITTDDSLRSFPKLSQVYLKLEPGFERPMISEKIHLIVSGDLREANVDRPKSNAEIFDENEAKLRNELQRDGKAAVGSHNPERVGSTPTPATISNPQGEPK